MKYFYKIIDGKLQRGSGHKIPTGFIEYTRGNEPQELIDGLAYVPPEQQTININHAIQNHLDTKAQEFRYDNMMSARSYAGYTNAFQTEAQSLATWASDCWVKAGEIEADVQSGARVMPTVDEVLAELPKFEE